MPIDTLTRRHLVAIVATAGASVLGTGLSTGAFALSAGEAEHLVISVSRDIQRVINSGKSENAIVRDFERIFMKYADIAIMAQSSLGVARRFASSSQVRNYTEAFRGYLAHKYGKRFREFVGAEIKVVKSRKTRRGYLVTTSVKMPGRPAFAVEWQVSDASGSTRAFDLIIEGISMLRLEREEIARMLDRRGGDIDRLIAHLRTAG
ncbi:MAG: ABC transporter substrate-binding protein [Rhodobacteraceae bacterium]|nr:ABC transporter substrate-binding protein [Paracoccaceae bacterium]